jgi:pyruvate dehydrogenase E1 component beta subunit
VTELNILESIRSAMDEEMDRDPSVMVLGEDVGKKGGVFGATEGLWSKYGGKRVLDTPLSEGMIAGAAAGAALYGLRPIAEMQFADFVYPAFNQIVSEISRMRYRSNGTFELPMVIRMPYGGGVHGALYHSQSNESYFTSTVGLKVVAPGTPADAKGLLKAAIRDPNPVIFLENEIVYGRHFPVPKLDDFVLPIGKARIVRPGKDVTIVAYSITVGQALEAAEKLVEQGIDAEVIDLRTLRPLDMDTVIASVKKTNRIVTIEQAWPICSIGSEISAQVALEAFDYLDAPPMKVSGKDVPMPYAANLEKLALPTVDDLIAAVKAVSYKE